MSGTHLRLSGIWEVEADRSLLIPGLPGLAELQVRPGYTVSCDPASDSTSNKTTTKPESPCGTFKGFLGE